MCKVVVLVYACVWCVMTVDGSAQDDNSGDPLFLTPLLERHKVEEAQRLSKVTPDIGNMTSYSGYLTVNKSCGSHLFFWFFPAQNSWKEAPVVLWLQGGPGASSLFGLFVEIGPLTYDGMIRKREYSWNVENNLLFIDQPVGTGFSFSEKECYAKNDVEVGRDLYSGVVQFYQLFPELQNNRFFISGESYAGHYIPTLGYTIHKSNPTASVKINLMGMMIGNGWMDGNYQIGLGSFLYQHGLIDDAGIHYMAHYHEYVGNVSLYNYLDSITELDTSWQIYIEQSQTRKALHVGNKNYSFFSNEVHLNLGIYRLTSMIKPWIEELLEHYPMVFYTGQLDIICAYPTVVNFLKALQWSGKSQFQSSPRQKWCVGDLQAGYFKGAHNLYDVMVRKAGHLVPFHQPHWSYILANSITSGTPSNPLDGLATCE